MDQQRLLLEQLMKPMLPTKKKNFTDDDVCKNYLVSFCPNELFLNTKVDLGKCPLIHDESLQKEYQKTTDRIYDEKFYATLQRLMNDVERTIKKSFARLEHKNDHVFDNLLDINEKIIILEEQIVPKITEIYELGSVGKVAEAMDIFYHVLKSNQELEVTRQSDPNSGGYRTDKRLEVCHVCGALLANDSTGARIDAHMVGKQHTGFLRIRKTIEEFGPRLQKLRERKDAALGKEKANQPYHPYNRRDRDSNRDRPSSRDNDRRSGREDHRRRR